MGEVWLATEARLRRKVALKFLPVDVTSDASRVSRFGHEACAASALNHPDVCTILGVGETAEGQHYIAMEYVEGETLRQRLAAGALHLQKRCWRLASNSFQLSRQPTGPASFIATSSRRTSSSDLMAMADDAVMGDVGAEPRCRESTTRCGVAASAVSR